MSVMAGLTHGFVERGERGLKFFARKAAWLVYGRSSPSCCAVIRESKTVRLFFTSDGSTSTSRRTLCTGENRKPNHNPN